MVASDAVKRGYESLGPVARPRQPTRATLLRYGCPICGTRFDDRAELNEHAWRRHEGTGRSYRCADRDQVSASRRWLMDHRTRAHGSE